MILITVDLFENNSFEIIVKGHSENEACARVSTLTQIFKVLFTEKLEIDTTENGYSHFKGNEFTEYDYNNVLRMVKCLKDLALLYKTNIRIEVLNNGKKLL